MEQYFTVPLQEPLTFHIVWLITALLLLVAAAVLFTLVWRKYAKVLRAKDDEIAVRRPMPMLAPGIKNKYLARLAALEKAVNEDSVDYRSAYQELSRIIRLFVYEMTRVRVQNYSFREIRAVGIPALTELVREYYEPEFSYDSKGNVTESLAKTRQVIERWN